MFFVSGLLGFVWLVFTAVSLSDIASAQKRIANVLEQRYGKPGSEPKKPGESGFWD